MARRNLDASQRWKRAEEGRLSGFSYPTASTYQQSNRLSDGGHTTVT